MAAASPRTADGRKVAFVDIDQLGICYPERAEDRGRHRLKAANVDALRRTFGAAGAEGLIVSGVVDPVTGPLVAGAVLAIRLRADPAELVERLASRPGLFAEPRAVLDEAVALDQAGFDAEVVETTGLTVDEIAADLDARVRSWQTCRVAAEPPTIAGAAGQVLWLSGPSGVGKSTIGFRTYVDALPNVAFTSCALHADAPELTRRILSRGAGGSWPQPGDPRHGQPRTTLLAAAKAVLTTTNWPPP